MTPPDKRAAKTDANTPNTTLEIADKSRDSIGRISISGLEMKEKAINHPIKAILKASIPVFQKSAFATAAPAYAVIATGGVSGARIPK